MMRIVMVRMPLRGVVMEKTLLLKTVLLPEIQISYYPFPYSSKLFQLHD